MLHPSAVEWLAIPLALVAGAIVQWVGGRDRWRGVLLSLPMFAMPWLATTAPVRMVVAAGAAVTFLRALELRMDRRTWSGLRRMWFGVSIPDSRDFNFVARAWDGRRWGTFVLMGIVSATAGYVLWIAGEMHIAWRWLVGTVFIYCMFESLHALTLAGHLVAGVAIRPFHIHPIASRTVAEFWGQRWNMVVHNILSRVFFRPIARRGRVALGVLAAFGASALLHAWLIFVCLGWYWAAIMGAFFAAQGAVMLIERRIGVSRWPETAGRAWTIVTVAGTSPLFTEPLLRAFF